jgi:hypothetical protein
VENRFQMVDYAVLTVAGLCIAASLLSPGFIPEASSLTPVTLGALGMSLALSAVWSGLRPAHGVALLLNRHETPAGPRDGA